MTLPLLAIQVVETQSDFERVVDVIADIAIIVIALALIALGFALIYGALKARAMMKRMRADFDPAVRNVNAVAANAEYMSRAVREDVERLSATLQAANGKVQGAMAATERRLGELDALMGVVQAEAESLFVRGAATVRGVQVGAAALRGLRGRRRDEEDEFALEEEVEEELDELMDEEFEDDDEVDDDEDEPVRDARFPRRGRDILDD